MIVAVADTHAMIWYLSNDKRLSKTASALFNRSENATGDNIGFSSISLIEMVYLTEKGTFTPDLLSKLETALSDSDSIFVEVHVSSTILSAVKKMPRTAVPDMPDRIIAATALHLEVDLISHDAKIQLSGVRTVW